MTFVLLPGLDGTARLFQPLIEALGADALPVAYPPDQPLGYDELLPYVRARLPERPFVLVGESFSGPLAIRLAADPPRHLRGLVLVATFARRPLPIPRWVARLVSPMVSRLPPPALLLRWLLLGADAPAPLVAELQAAIRAVAPAVFSRRCLEILAVDVRDDLARVDRPALYLQAARDRLVGPRCLAALRAARPALQVASLDAPHLALQRAPDEAARRLRSFAAALPGRRHPLD